MPRGGRRWPFGGPIWAATGAVRMLTTCRPARGTAQEFSIPTFAASQGVFLSVNAFHSLNREFLTL